jgi:hypothetical protein
MFLSRQPSHAAVLAALSLVVAAPAPLPLGARLIRAGDFAGFRPESGPRSSFTTPELWVSSNPSLNPSQRKAEIARLRRHGFAGLLSEFLNRKARPESGVSWVMRLRSAAAARAELQANFAYFKALDKSSGGSFTEYSVPAIAGARGFRVLGQGQVGENVFFADGPFLYLVGAGWPITDKSAPTRAALIVAVKRLYARVHGHPAAVKR